MLFIDGVQLLAGRRPTSRGLFSGSLRSSVVARPLLFELWINFAVELRSQEEQDDFRDDRGGQHPRVPGQGGKATGVATATGKTEKPQSARRPGGTPKSENRKLEKL
jgi:hypothetical protein